MAASARPAERLALRVLTAADAACDWLYGWRYNPLYQSGTIVVALFLTLLVTGVWLILFYRVGAPWASVARLTDSPWTGNWVRGLHRYASDAAVVATLAHAFRMFAQARSWGPRALAWVTGGVLLLLIFVCGWTGYVMVWDTFGQLLAREGARMLDTLPVLSEPTSRAFTGERAMPSAFFFLNLFAHIGIPLAIAVLFWLHVTRIARPALLPPRTLMWSVIGVLTAVAVVRPLVMAPEASPFNLPQTVPADLFFAFWVPLSRAMSGGAAIGVAVTAFAALVAVPLVTRRNDATAPAPSKVDESVCVGCVQCSLDCPYEAITMIARAGGRSDLVARVDPAMCVSCGICAGSCAPMGVGPPGRTGRDQVAGVRAFIGDPARRANEIVVVCCEHGAAMFAPAIAAEDATAYPVDCAGNLHTSVIELLIRGGSAGVLVLSCPPRDCRNREGPRWLRERVYGAREAELQARVDRRRVKIAYAAARERRDGVDALRAFAAEIRTLAAPTADATLEVDTTCDPVPAETE